MLRPVVAPLQLPIQYSRPVQGLVHHLLQRDVGEQVHRDGPTAGAWGMHLFPFSQLPGSYALEHETESIIFARVAPLVVTSRVEELVQSLAGALVDRQRLQLGEAAVGVERAHFEQPRVQGERAASRTLGLVTIYSTVNRPEGTRFITLIWPVASSSDSLCRTSPTNAWLRVERPMGAGGCRCVGSCRHGRSLSASAAAWLK